MHKVDMGMGQPRELAATTPQGLSALGFSHPEMQEALLESAGRVGAEVRRGAAVTAIEPGRLPQVQLLARRATPRKSRPASSSLPTAASPPLASGQDSRWSPASSFPVCRSPAHGLAMPRDLGHYCFNPAIAMATAIVHEGKDRFRAYLAYPTDGMERLQGEQALPRFLEQPGGPPRLPISMTRRSRHRSSGVAFL